MDKIEILKNITPTLLTWYDQVRRPLPWRENGDAYRIWISEIMLQQTRIEAVKPYYERFLAVFPDIPALASAQEERVLKMWEGLGYYSRARNLQKTAQICVERYGGSLPPSYEELKSLPGIGNYTAGAIGSIAFRLPVPAVDGNVLRVLSRIFADDRDITKQSIKSKTEKMLLQVVPTERPGTFNEAIMEVGETVCIPNGTPLCEECPFTPVCRAYHLGEQEKYPVKASKKARKIEERTVLLLECGDRIAIRQRPARGLLAGLYEFPCLGGRLDETQLRHWLEDADVGIEGKANEIESLGSAKHVFSHVEWHMVGYRIPLTEELGGDWIYVDRDMIRREYPIPTAYQAYITYL